MVKAWREVVTIPTYEAGKPEKNPVFLEKRVYQGSSGAVYPYPVIESVSDQKVDKDYQAIWLENEYIKVMILPELGGRVQMAYDKLARRHFVYFNHVIKPALVGLAGPWISGGIEFNWPQHHRPSTFQPVDACIEQHADGSVSVWVNEVEQMSHQQGSAGFTLRPGCAYLEIKGRVYNRTDVPQTFLWWANPAVEVNDAYQSVFPPDINAVFDHGKRAVSSFPIATGTYYKVDYSAGVDISNYKNIPVPTSYMGVNSRFDFEGGYENDTHAGMLHVASHHFSPGKKQWTWGNGDFGRAWDRNLTDEPSPEEMQRWNISRRGFRPYIELMAGVYTENQPDFSWLMPYEEKCFTQYFMPYRELGVVKVATKDLLFNIAGAEDGHVEFKLFATHRQTVSIILRSDSGTEYYRRDVTLSPEDVFIETADVHHTPLNALSLEVTTHAAYGERTLLSWHAEPDDIRPIPDSAKAALPPSQVKTCEQLFLTGLHLEQYRHATWSPTDYYEEALRRDPDDIRCLNALGLWYLRKGRPDKAEGYLRRAVKLAQTFNPNPYDGEPIYNLALALKRRAFQLHFLKAGCACDSAGSPTPLFGEAYELFWKATWNKAWADAGYFEAARISTLQGRYEDALDEVCRCLVSGGHNHKARALKAAILRKLGRSDEALALIDESLQLDLFNYGCRYERHLITGETLSGLKQLMRHAPQNYDELALDYAAAGLSDEARAVWQMAIDEGAVTPMTYYYLGRFADAEAADPACCFPGRLEDVAPLEAAKRCYPQGGKAPYYLGCLYYAARQYDLAISNWELSARVNPDFPTVWRNLALARYNKQGRPDEALQYMERAFHLGGEHDGRVLMELDQLYKRLRRPPAQRLALLDEHPDLVGSRDDLTLERITLLGQLGRYEEARQQLDSHHFHPWEGGEGKVAAQYQFCRVEMAKQAIAIGSRDELMRAVGLLDECLHYPANLGEGKLQGAQENDFYYLLGIAYDGLGEKTKARDCWMQATLGPQEPAPALYYNDARPDKIFYQGLALYKLGRKDEAHGRFHRLTDYGKQHIFEHPVMDYFAVSLPDLLIWEDSLTTQNRIHCTYMLALGYYGLGDMARAEKYLAELEALDKYHQGALQLRTLMKTIS